MHAMLMKSPADPRGGVVSLRRFESICSCWVERDDDRGRLYAMQESKAETDSALTSSEAKHSDDGPDGDGVSCVAVVGDSGRWSERGFVGAVDNRCTCIRAVEGVSVDGCGTWVCEAFPGEDTSDGCWEVDGIPVDGVGVTKRPGAEGCGDRAGSDAFNGG